MLEELDSFLKYENQELNIEGEQTSQYVGKFGTPLMIFSSRRILENAKSVQNAIKDLGKGFYSYKANDLNQICQLIHSTGIGAEVSSINEFQSAMSFGQDNLETTFSGIGRTSSEFKHAINNAVNYIYLASQNEINKFAQAIMESSSKDSRIGMRINLGWNPESQTHDNDWSIFGFSESEAKKLFLNSSKRFGFKFSTFQSHQLQRCDNPHFYSQLINHSINLALEIGSASQVNIELINLGGGLDSRALIESRGHTLNDFLAPIKKHERAHKYQFSIELGRYIVNDAAVVLTRIIEKRDHTLIVDAGTNLLIPLASADYRAVPTILPRNANRVNHVIKDRLCSPTGLICKKAELPENLKEGQIIAILNCGAYTVPLANNWMYPIPKIVLARNGLCEILDYKPKVNFDF